MTRFKGTHVFTVTMNVPLGTHYYQFVENGKAKSDPKKPTGTDMQTGNICNKIIIDSVEQPPPVVDPTAHLSGPEKVSAAMSQLSFQTGVQCCLLFSLSATLSSL